MSKRKFKLISIVSIVLLALVILLNITATLAYFTDKKELTTPDLKFGNIKINANNEIGANSYFATNSLENIKPGDYVLNDDVKFSLDATSEPAYIRAKYKITLSNTTQSAETDLAGYLKYGTLTTTVTSDYCWSEKIGDYYYLLDASTRQPLVVSDSSKTYTFISKENSKIADNYFSNLTSAGTSVNLSIGVEAIQVANLASSDTTKTTLELIKENLDNVNNVSSSGTYNIDFVVSGTTYSVSGVGYSEDATIPDSVITLLNSSSFGGFAFSENGYPVITKTSSGHSWIDITNKKLKNITEDLKLYAVDNSALETNYLVTFKNGTEILQATRVLNGKCEYLGDVPTKTATNEKEYVFAGWQIDGTGDIYTDLSNITISKDTTFVASFVESDRTFEIVYVLNGGGFKNEKIQTIKSTYTYGNAVTLPTADDMFKKDYTFDGWYETSNFSGNKVTTISATQSGNKTYYAKWTYNGSTLTLNLNGGGITE